MNLLADPLIRAAVSDTSHQRKTTKHSLPGVLAALTRNEITCFPGLRPHQVAPWQMFLAQLGALALHQSGQTRLPDTEDDWRKAIRALTPKFPEDEPWQLVVDDWRMPAFMQPPEPNEGARYTGTATTPDALDMLVTSKNHDLKQAVAIDAEMDEWVFALICLQTGEGYNGAGNNGIARMNGGSSSRVCFSLLPLAAASSVPTQTPAVPGRPGARFTWEVTKLLRDRDAQNDATAAIGYASANGKSLLWTVPWPDGEKLTLAEIDIWFIEICRRIRLRDRDGGIIAETGTTKSERVDAKMLKGITGDPWAPVNIQDQKSLTIGEQDFNYRLLSKVLFGSDWRLPPMLKLSKSEQSQADNWLLSTQAIGRGNSKTYGYRERILPLTLQTAATFGMVTARETLGELAGAQIDEIKKFKAALGTAIALFVEGGDWEEITKESYERAALFQDRLDAVADAQFFPALWQRFDASKVEGDDHAAFDAAKLEFLKFLLVNSNALLDEATSSLPCATLFHHRATVRADSAFNSLIRSEKKGFPALRTAQKSTDPDRQALEQDNVS